MKRLVRLSDCCSELKYPIFLQVQILHLFLLSLYEDSDRVFFSLVLYRLIIKIGMCERIKRCYKTLEYGINKEVSTNMTNTYKYIEELWNIIFKTWSVIYIAGKMLCIIFYICCQEALKKITALFWELKFKDNDDFSDR